MNNQIKKNNLTNDVTNNSLKNKVYITNTLEISKKNIQINKDIINRYSFLSSYIHEEALFFEDIYYSIFYILTFEIKEEDEEKSECFIYNFIVDKMNKSYSKNSLPYYDFKNSLLNLIHLDKRSFIYSQLHLSSYEYDLNHDINEWLNMVKYEDIVYIYPYISRKEKIECDYHF